MKTTFAASALLAIAPALFAVGCGGGGGGGSSPGARPFVSASTQGTAPATALAMLATLNALDSANHPPLQGSAPLVTTTGTPTAGTVTLDFGTGTIVNNATWRGEVRVTYSSGVSNGSGSGTANVSINMDDLEFTTASAGTVQVAGTVVLGSFSYSSSSAAATGPNTLLVTIGGATYEMDASAYAWTFDTVGAERLEITEVDSFVDLGTGILVDLADIEMAFSGGNRAILSGDAVGIRGGIVQSFEFEVPNGGTLITAPPGSIRSFSF